MVFELVGAEVVADSVDGLPLKALIDEVGRFFIPTFRDVILFNCDLACEDLITDIFASATFIGALTHHALISDDTDGKIVRS